MTINSSENIGSLGDKVYLELEKDIISGTIAAGESLSECKLSAKYGVSRTPVRDALKSLEKQGLVEIIPNKCAVVVGVSTKDVEDIYDIRICVEGLASRLACQNITDEEIERLTEAVELQEFYLSKENSSQMKDLDSKFHSLIYEFSRNKILRNTLNGYHHTITKFRQVSLNDRTRTKDAVEEHRHILEAIKKRDADLADALTITHIKNAKANMIKAFQKVGK
ncbi:MAG: GntR family transcriptional regulator [Oscillospiraceae bacterium]